MRDWEQFVRQNLPLPELDELKDERIISEVADHLEDLYREAIRRGVSVEAAEEFVRSRMGDLDAAAIDLIRSERPSTRAEVDAWFAQRAQAVAANGHGRRILADLGQDLRHSLRSLSRRPGFAIISALILAIGIGAVTTVYSTYHAVVLRPMPFHEPERLFWIWEVTPAGQFNSLSAFDFFDLRERTHSFESVCARYVFRPSVIVTGTTEADRVGAMIVSNDFFSTLGVAPALGRGFLEAEMEPSAAPVCVISHGFWQDRLGGAAGVVGSSLTIDGGPCEVVGIMPSGFAFPSGVDIWVPLTRDAGYAQGRGNNNFFLIARLADGVTAEQADEETAAIMAQIAEENPSEKEGLSVVHQPLHEVFYGSLRPMMRTFLAAVLLVLLIACANISSLFLAHATSMQQEVAVRFALGATRWRVVRRLLTESLLVALSGGGLGLLVTVGGIAAVRNFAAASLPRAGEIGIDGNVILVVAVVTILSGLVFGIMPALRSTRFALARTIKEGRAVTEGIGGMRLRSLLVIGQVGLSLILLISSGLLLRSLAHLQHTDPGVEVPRLLNLRLQIPAFTYDTEEKQVLFFTGLIEHLTARPEIAGAACADQLPFQGDGPWNGLHRPENPPEKPEDLLRAHRRIVSDGYFRTLGIPLLAGREFTATDAENSPPVVVVNRALAEAYFPGEQAMGKTLAWGSDYIMEIVGIVGDVFESGPGSVVMPMFYLPFRKFPDATMELTVRATGTPEMLTTTVRQVIQEMDRNIPIWNVQTMESRFDATLAGNRLQTLLLGIFAAVALVMATMGLFGVLTYFVNQRTHEMGIRIALGAGRRQILGVVILRGLALTLIGIVVGLGGAVAFTGLLESMLFETPAVEPLTFLTTSVILALVAIVACLVPAGRAVRVDPLTVMRTE